MSNSSIFSKQITKQGYKLFKRRLDSFDIQKIKSDLTVSPKGQFIKKNKNKKIKRELWTEDENYICIPKFYGLSNYGKPDKDLLSLDDEIEKHNFVFTGMLKEKQQKVIDIAMPKILENGGGLIIESCGFGKTIVMCYIACYLGVKTLFLTHTDNLAIQAKKDFKKVSNIKLFGSIIGKNVDIEGKGVVFGSIPSLMNIEKYDLQIFSKFGLILIDEVHHMGAEKYSNIFKYISTKYMVGVSATDFREDGLFNIIKWYIGDIMYRGEPIIKRMNAYVIKIFFYCTNPIKTENLKIKGCPKLSNIGGMVTNVALTKRRNRFLFYLLRELVLIGRKPLFIAKRKEQIYSLVKKFNKYGLKNDYGIIIGGKNKVGDTLEKVKSKKIILGIIQKTEEGLNLEDRDTLLYGCEIKKPNQSTGRLFRTDTYEKSRLVIDLVDVFDPYFLKQSEKRDEFFRLSDYKMYTTNIATNTLDESNSPGLLYGGYSLYNDIEAIKKITSMDMEFLKEYQ